MSVYESSSDAGTPTPVVAVPAFATVSPLGCFVDGRGEERIMVEAFDRTDLTPQVRLGRFTPCAHDWKAHETTADCAFRSCAHLL